MIGSGKLNKLKGGLKELFVRVILVVSTKASSVVTEQPRNVIEELDIEVLSVVPDSKRTAEAEGKRIRRKIIKISFFLGTLYMVSRTVRYVMNCY